MKKRDFKILISKKSYRTRWWLVVMMLFFLPASQVYAAWELVTKSARGDTYYLDSTVEKKGIITQVWGLVDLSEPIEGSKSVKRLYQFDCVKGKLRVNQRLAYADKGGQGASTSSEKNPGQWVYPDPESINEQLVLKICFDKKPATPKH
jgi:hypothetical protein